MRWSTRTINAPSRHSAARSPLPYAPPSAISTNKYFECERWAEEGLCSWLYVITDPDTGVEDTVPQACQLSCEAAACGASDGGGGVSRRRRSLAGTRNQQLKTAANEPGKVVPPINSDWKASQRTLQLGRGQMFRVSAAGTSPGLVPAVLLVEVEGRKRCCLQPHAAPCD